MHCLPYLASKIFRHATTPISEDVLFIIRLYVFSYLGFLHPERSCFGCSESLRQTSGISSGTVDELLVIRKVVESAKILNYTCSIYLPEIGVDEGSAKPEKLCWPMHKASREIFYHTECSLSADWE